MSVRSNAWFRPLAAAAAFILTLCLSEPGAALACSGCESKGCVHGLEQGMYGCSESEATCSWTAQILFGCSVKSCFTYGPICDNRIDRRPPILTPDPFGPDDPSKLGSPCGSNDLQDPLDALALSPAMEP